MVNSSRPVIMCWVLRSRSYSEVETGADPFELLLAALGACTAMTTRMYANRKGLRLGRVNVQLRHVQRASGSDIKDRFERVISLDGQLSTEEQQNLLTIANDAPSARR